MWILGNSEFRDFGDFGNVPGILKEDKTDILGFRYFDIFKNVGWFGFVVAGNMGSSFKVLCVVEFRGVPGVALKELLKVKIGSFRVN